MNSAGMCTSKNWNRDCRRESAEGRKGGLREPRARVLSGSPNRVRDLFRPPSSAQVGSARARGHWPFGPRSPGTNGSHNHLFSRASLGKWAQRTHTTSPTLISSMMREWGGVGWGGILTGWDRWRWPWWQHWWVQRWVRSQTTPWRCCGTGASPPLCGSEASPLPPQIPPDTQTHCHFQNPTS